ncbi:hypothetical protein LINGRAHAP2_LOCUS5658 [Linum grandiflorum]
MAELDQLIERIDSLWFFDTVSVDNGSSSTPPAAEKPAHDDPLKEPKEQSTDTEVTIFPWLSEEEIINFLPPPPPPPPLPEEEVRAEPEVFVEPGAMVFVSKAETAEDKRKRLARKWRSKKMTISREQLELCFDNFNKNKNLYGGFSSEAWLYGSPTRMMKPQLKC